jgi:hypothetical protein
LSLIYVKYPAMLINSLNKGFDRLSNRISSEELVGLFEFLYVKYETPKLLTINFWKAKPHEAEFMMYLFQGRNPRQILGESLAIFEKGRYGLVNITIW